MHEELKSLLQNKWSFVYIPNIGNAGDGFIAHSTYQMFDRLGLSYSIGDIHGVYPDQVVVYAGGGAFVEPYDYMVKFLRRNIGKWRELIVLPHTMTSYGEIIGELGPNSHLFCRENMSYDFVRSCASGANVYLCDDMAFDCRLEELPKLVFPWHRAGLSHSFAEPVEFIRLLRRLRRDRQLAGSLSRDALDAFREDVERTDIVVPPGNIDLSEVFAGNSMLPIHALHVTYRMMRFLGRFKSVKTNRLHVSIMSAMLGLDVTLYDNNYGKNRAIYERTMKGRFDNVRWRENGVSASVLKL
ncbi:exopolysaccharide biosynthesis predicted pyruvyl transferase EpsI [Bradyrhizobium sp. USDA 4463]